jgi:RNA polymerase sigma-70 factor (ECF subfamily)
MVHAVLLAAVRPVDAEDLLQEVFLSAWKGITRLRSDEHVGAWLAVIARNAARRFHARARPRPEPIPEMLPDRLAADGARVAEGAEILERVRALPEAYREVMLMRLVEGLSGPEIAAMTGLTPDSVRTNLSRGMKRLRESLRKRGWR